MQIKNFLNEAFSSSSSTKTPAIVNYSEEVQPVVIRKIPKILTRERHLAIRRRKPSSPESHSSESLQLSIDSDESISDDDK
jgi:hypothetical protein